MIRAAASVRSLLQGIGGSLVNKFKMYVINDVQAFSFVRLIPTCFTVIMRAALSP